MILAPKTTSTHLLSAWSAGVALCCLGIGLHGAGTPLLDAPQELPTADDDTVMVENFEPPASTGEEPTEPEIIKEEDIVIPPLPEITPPLIPPEMVEITPIEDAPPPKPIEKKPEPPKEKPKPAARVTPSPQKSTATGNNAAPTLFQGAGAGRFPQPAYPAAARAAKQQGSVRVLVTVEASGMPSGVEVSTSSGFAALDAAARDIISRRWRWPAGEVRKFIVPFRFILQ